MSVRVTKCCICIPLRYGLLLWGYFSLIATYLSALSSLYRLQDITYAPGPLGSNEFFYSFFSLFATLIYFIFQMILVAGLHKESSCMLVVHNGFLIISMLLEGIAAALYLPLAMRRYFYDYDEDIKSTIVSWFFICFAVVIIVAELLWKYYILVCVRSLISKLNGDKKDYLSEEDVDPDVIICDNKNKRKKETNIQPTGNSDVTVHDNNGTGSKKDNTESGENPNLSIHDNTSNRTKDDNIQQVGNSDVTVHDNTGTECKVDNIESVENPNVSIHDNTTNKTKDDNIQLVGTSDVTVHDDTKTGSIVDNVHPVQNPNVRIHDK